MLDQVFKKKDTGAYNELNRRSRVEKKSTRPMTAPSALESSNQYASAAMPPIGDSSCQQGSPPLFDEASTACANNLAQPPEVPPKDSQYTRPRSRTFPSMVRASSGSCEIRNPFRRNTSDTITTVAMSCADMIEFGEDVIPIERTVPMHYPTHIEAFAHPKPQKAAIFTRNTSEPYEIDPFSERYSDESTSPSASSTRLHEMQELRPAASKRSRWSFLRSPKADKSPKLPKSPTPSRRSVNFLEVQIPAGMFSPMREHRHSFWSS